MTRSSRWPDGPPASTVGETVVGRSPRDPGDPSPTPPNDAAAGFDDTPTISLAVQGPITASAGPVIDAPTMPLPVARPVEQAGSDGAAVGSPSLTGSIRRVAVASAIAEVVAQVVTLLQTVVLARILSPLEIGLFAAGTVITTFAADFSEGGMRASLVHREDDLDDAAETVFRATLVSGGLLSLAALATAPLVGLVFGNTTAALIAAASSGSLLLYAVTSVPEAMLQRAFSVKRRLIVGPTITISFAGSSVIFALLGYGVWSLVIGTYVMHVCWITSVWLLAGWRPGRAGRASMAEWRRLSRYSLPLVIGLIGAKAQQMVESVAVGRGLSTEALGFYRYGTRISRVPVNATVEIVANALFPAFSRMTGDPERLRDGYLRALTAVTFFAAAVSGLIFAVGEPAVVVLLSERWRGAGVAVVAMAGLGLGKALASVSEEAIKVAGHTRLLNRMTAAELALGIGLLTLIIPFGLVGVGLAISLTALIIGFLGLFMVRGAVGVTMGSQLRAIGPSVAAALVALASTWFLEHHLLHSDTHGTGPGLLLLLVDALAFGVVYLLVVLVLSPKTVRGVVRVASGRSSVRG